MEIGKQIKFVFCPVPLEIFGNVYIRISCMVIKVSRSLLYNLRYGVFPSWVMVYAVQYAYYYVSGRAFYRQF